MPLSISGGYGPWLRLAYDNIEAHGGELKVSSIQGEGAKFSIILDNV